MNTDYKMKYTLSNISTPNFTADSEGFYPYESKWSKPVSKIEVAQTPYSVRSLGLSAYWYTNLGLSAPLKGAPGGSPVVYQGNMPLVKFWHVSSHPPVIPNYGNSTNIRDWALLLNGAFKAPYDGNYIFHFGGQGEVHTFQFDYVHYLATGQKLVLNKQDTSDHTLTITGLTAGNWYQIMIIYYSEVVEGIPAGLVVKWSHADHPEKLILSGGVTRLDTDSGSDMPIPYRELSNISNVKLNRAKNAVSKLVFNVPLVATGAPYGEGYAYDTTNKYYYDVSDTSVPYALKKFWMIKYQEGYQNSSDTDELVTQFVGQIRDLSIKFTPKGMPELQVTAYDYGIFAKDTINKNSPDELDYIAFDYREPVIGHVNGAKKPPAYDGWEVHKAVQNLMVNSYIDPILFTNKKQFIDYDGNATASGYHMYGIDLSEPNYLPIQENYGNPDVVTGDSQEPDDEYLYGVNLGEKNYDMINNILEPYAMDWGMTSSGYPFIKAYNVPTHIVDNVDMDTAGHVSMLTEVGCYKATMTLLTNAFYTMLGIDLGSASCQVTGTKFDAITGNLVYIGDSGHVYIRKDGVELASAHYFIDGNGPLYDWLYYDGPHPTEAQNRTVLHVAENLPYDTYSMVFVSGHTTQPVIGFTFASMVADAAFGYDENVDYPVFYLKSGDSSTPASLISVDVTEKADTIRNESIVVGSRLGITVAENENRVFDAVNPNNPQFEHIVSRTLDINSVYKSTADNYVGRELTTMIFDPAINDQDQADFLGYGLVNEFRQPNKEVSIQALGNPLLDVGDCIGVKEEKRGIITYDEKVWIEEITTSRDKTGKYTMSLKTSPIKPVTSWWSKPLPDLENFDNQPFQNVQIYNGGGTTILGSPLSATDTSMVVVRHHLYYGAELPGFGLIDAESIPKSGYLRFIPDGDDKRILPYALYGEHSAYEIIKYEGVSGAYTGQHGDSVYKLYNLTRGLQYTKPTAHAISADLVIGYDPYTQDSMGIYPIIQFDLLRTGRVQCWIDAMDARTESGHYNTQNRPVPVDNCAWDGKEDINSANKKMVWGRNRSFIWGGLDNIGQWNRYYSDDPSLTTYGNIFVAEQFKRRRIFNEPHVSNDLKPWISESYVQYPYTRCRVRLILNTDDGETYSTTLTQDIHVRRGAPGVLDFKVDYENLREWKFDTYPNGSYYETDEGPITYRFDDPRYFGNNYPSPENAIFGPTSNSGRGLKLKIHQTLHASVQEVMGIRNDATADPHFVRYYSADIEAVILTEAWRCFYSADGDEWPNSMWSGGQLMEPIVERVQAYRREEIADSYIEETHKYFYPMRSDPSINYLPNELRTALIEEVDSSSQAYEGMFVQKCIIFKGNFVDKSGREAFLQPLTSWVPHRYQIFPNLMPNPRGFNGAGIDYNYPESGYGRAWNGNNGLYEAEPDALTEEGDSALKYEMGWRGNFVGWIDEVGKRGGRPWLADTEPHNLPDRVWDFGFAYLIGDI